MIIIEKDAIFEPIKLLGRSISKKKKKTHWADPNIRHSAVDCDIAYLIKDWVAFKAKLTQCSQEGKNKGFFIYSLSIF